MASFPGTTKYGLIPRYYKVWPHSQVSTGSYPCW